MPNIYIVKSSDIFIEALECYKKHLKLNFEIKKFDKSHELNLDESEFSIVLNDEPEKLDGIRAIQFFREPPGNCAIPVVFISEALSEEAQVMFKDFELVWQCNLPFNSGDFIILINKIADWIDEHRDTLKMRLKVQKCLMEQNYQNAYDLAKALNSKYDNKFRCHLLISQSAMLLGRYDEAIEEVNNALAINNQSLEANSLLAKIYHLQGNKVESEKIIENTMKAAEIYLKNLIHWGDVYIERGETEKSITAYEIALEKDPANQRAKEGLLAANLIEGKTSLVQHALTQAGATTELARICNLKGISMANAGKYQIAERLYNNAMQFLPTEEKSAHKLWLNLGLCMKKKGDMKAALHYFYKCQETAPSGYDRVEPQINYVLKKLEEEKALQEEKANQLKKIKSAPTTINYNKHDKK